MFHEVAINQNYRDELYQLFYSLALSIETVFLHTANHITAADNHFAFAVSMFLKPK